MAWRGLARHDRTGQGKADEAWQTGPVLAGQGWTARDTAGQAGRGVSRLGAVRHDRAWQAWQLRRLDNG